MVPRDSYCEREPKREGEREEARSPKSMEVTSFMYRFFCSHSLQKKTIISLTKIASDIKVLLPNWLQNNSIKDFFFTLCATYYYHMDKIFKLFDELTERIK